MIILILTLEGEIHALAGENGSGKSTFISIMCGLCPADSGEMLINGDVYNPTSPLEANDKKIGFVVQELGLVDNLPIAMNMFLGDMTKYTKHGILKIGKLFIDNKRN